MAANPTQITLGEFCKGRSKQNIQKNPNIAFVIMTLDKKDMERKRKMDTPQTGGAGV